MANKNYGYKEFNLTKHISIYCWTYETRYSWGHKAELSIDGSLISSDKIRYYNRTWERYTYESILSSIVDKTKQLTDKQAKACKKAIKDHGNTLDPFFKTVANVAKMGEFLAGGSQKSINDWKARMIKAGLGSYGLMMPDDWDELSEDEKESRLNQVIAELETK